MSRSRLDRASLGTAWHDFKLLLQKYERSETTMLDRWSITVSDIDPDPIRRAASSDGLEVKFGRKILLIVKHKIDFSWQDPNGQRALTIPKMLSEHGQIPFTIINNYFSIGVVGDPHILGSRCARLSIIRNIPGRSYLLQVSLGARKEPKQVQQPHEEQDLVLRVRNLRTVLVLVQKSTRKHRTHCAWD